EIGNPLLASMGRMGRDFFNVIIEDSTEYELFDEPGEGNLLTTIQSDIYHLRWRGKDIEQAFISEDDISIQVHSCHSPMREVEVLYNNLLFLFERYKDLRPKDIIVMTPNIETYAPFISAVFDGYYDERTKIPYSIADRGAATESPVVNIFLKILNLLNGRFYASEVMDVIDDIYVKERFGLKDRDIESILRWINDTNIRWGIDEKHREAHGNPSFKDNSWQAGIERLLLGYAMSSKEEEPFKGILAYNDMEGDYVETFEHLLDFLLPLFEYSKEITNQYRLDEWAGILDGILDTFIAVNEDSVRDVQFIRETILNLKKIMVSAGFNRAVSFGLVLHYLKNRLNIREFSTGFITGGITFCEMLPMRSIPFKVVALIGMNNDTYPRESRPLGFDMIAKNPRRGDRSLRDEDRYLFLEAILSARLCLYISYTGQSIKDNSTILPSVLVSELLDYIEKGFYHPEKNPLNIIIKKHPLQAFSPRYFQKDSNIFSYSQEDYEAITVCKEKEYNERPFIITPLNEPAFDFRNITNAELKRFFLHPVKYFFNNRLGIFLDEKSTTPKDEEPLELDNLDEFIIRTSLTDKMVSYADPKKAMETIYGQGILPPRSPGRVFLDRTMNEAKTFLKKITGFIDDRKDPIDFTISIDEFKIKVRIEDIYSLGIVRYRCSNKIKAKYIIELWIDHVLMNLYKPEKSFYLSMNETHSFKPINNGEDIIKSLLKVYEEGIKTPISFFPETSFRYAEQLKKKGHGAALASAKNKWKNENKEGEPAESEDPYYRFCFGDYEPLDEAFTEISNTVLEPLLEHMDQGYENGNI
ncbi:MAG: exodeoxyribonuclease V subunit gamma, partial [Syntrophorhabdaceae bacterium]|nr:exodeoxyribonuclease V subunit gamma [Syntrophorhabdaceae bacterium]